MRTLSIIFSSCLLWLWLLAFPGTLLGDDGLRFYYFNPDSPQNNLGRLKSDMETLLEGFSLPIEFQPFAHLNDFDSQVRKDQPAFVFAPHWYLKRYVDELGFMPLLQAVRHQRNDYQKLLVSKRNGDSEFPNSGRKTLAMTSLGPDSKELLSSILDVNELFNVDQLSIVEVPKDADAIFAAALGQVDVALVTQANLKLFQTINPKLIDSLRIYSEFAPVDMPVLGFIKGAVSEEQTNKLKKFMLSSKDSTVMHSLQIDGWSDHAK
ncbi:MAG: PhnD/SsuA/transferrin family substrate-binding protein [Candidatus Thiodiazotropha sp. DIVDIV]